MAARTTLEVQTWRLYWRQALQNMPYMAKCTVQPYYHGGPTSIYYRGKAVALRMCLGYQVYSGSGRSNAQMATYNAIKRGAMPHCPKRQRLLQALAGPRGATLARVRLVQFGQADRFKYWPTWAGSSK